MAMHTYESISNGLPNVILLGISSISSVIGSLVVMITYFLYKDIRTVSRHVVVCISISDLTVTFFNFLALLMSPEIDSGLTLDNLITCQIQSFVSTTAVLWSFLWTMVLAVYLYCVLVKENTRLAKNIIWPWAHLFCWILPLAINVTALFLGKLGSSGDRNTAGWCWINVFSK